MAGTNIKGLVLAKISSSTSISLGSQNRITIIACQGVPSRATPCQGVPGRARARQTVPERPTAQRATFVNNTANPAEYVPIV